MGQELPLRPSQNRAPNAYKIILSIIYENAKSKLSGKVSGTVYYSNPVKADIAPLEHGMLVRWVEDLPNRLPIKLD